MPYPMVYTPWTGGRVAGIAGGIMIIIDAILALMLGIITFGEWEFALGSYLIIAAIIAIVGAVTVFIARFPYLGIVGPVMLIVGGVWVMAVLWFIGIVVGIIGIILAVIGLVLVLVGWKDMQHRIGMRNRMQPPYPPMAMGPVAPPPPEYGDGPGGPRF
jgi:hypothetical protein